MKLVAHVMYWELEIKGVVELVFRRSTGPEVKEELCMMQLSSACAVQIGDRSGTSLGDKAKALGPACTYLPPGGAF